MYNKGILQLDPYQIAILKKIITYLEIELENIIAEPTSTITQLSNHLNHLIANAKLGSQHNNEILTSLEAIAEKIQQEHLRIIEVIRATIVALQAHLQAIQDGQAVASHNDQTFMLEFYHAMQDCQQEIKQHRQWVEQTSKPIAALVAKDAELSRIWQLELADDAAAADRRHAGIMEPPAKLTPAPADNQKYLREIIEYFDALNPVFGVRKDSEIAQLQAALQKQWAQLADQWLQVVTHLLLLDTAPTTTNFTAIYANIHELMQLTSRLAGALYLPGQNQMLAVVLPLAQQQRRLDQLSQIELTQQQKFAQQIATYRQEQQTSDTAITQILGEILAHWQQQDHASINPNLNQVTLNMLRTTQQNVVAEFLTAIQTLLLAIKKNNSALVYEITDYLAKMLKRAQQLQQLVISKPEPLTGTMPQLPQQLQRLVIPKPEPLAGTMQQFPVDFNRHCQFEIFKHFREIREAAAMIHNLAPTLYGTIQKMARMANEELPAFTNDICQYMDIINKFLQAHHITTADLQEDNIDRICKHWGLNRAEWLLLKNWLQHQNQHAQHLNDKHAGQIAIQNSLGMSLGEKHTVAEVWQQALEQKLFAADKPDQLTEQQALWQHDAQKKIEQQQELVDIKAMIMKYLRLDPTTKIDDAQLQRRAEAELLNSSGCPNQVIPYDDLVKITRWCASVESKTGKHNIMQQQGAALAKKYFVINDAFNQVLLVDLILNNWLQQSHFSWLSKLGQQQLESWARKMRGVCHKHDSTETRFVMRCLGISFMQKISDFALLTLAKEALADPTSNLKQEQDQRRIKQWIKQIEETYANLTIGGKNMIMWFCNINKTRIQSKDVNFLSKVTQQLLQNPHDFAAVLSAQEQQYLQDYLTLMKFMLKYRPNAYNDQLIIQKFTTLNIADNQRLLAQSLAKKAHQCDFSQTTPQEWQQIKISFKRVELSNVLLVNGRRELTAMVNNLPEEESQRVIALIKAGMDILNNSAHPIHEKPEVVTAIQAWIKHQLCYLHFMIYYAKQQAHCAKNQDFEQYVAIYNGIELQPLQLDVMQQILARLQADQFDRKLILLPAIDDLKNQDIQAKIDGMQLLQAITVAPPEDNVQHDQMPPAQEHAEILEEPAEELAEELAESEEEISEEYAEELAEELAESEEEISEESAMDFSRK